MLFKAFPLETGFKFKDGVISVIRYNLYPFLITDDPKKEKIDRLFLKLQRLFLKMDCLQCLD